MIDSKLQRKVRDAITSHLRILSWIKETKSSQQKVSAFTAFQSLFDEDAESLCAYLVHKSHSTYQSKLLQAYAKHIESLLPMANGPTNLDDNALNLFDGKSTFANYVGEDGIVKNKTIEVLISRNGVVKPFYIGKLLSIRSVDGANLLSNVNYYSFHTIKMLGIEPYTTVIVEHYRLTPHYNMGAMLHINNARTSIQQVVLGN